MLLSLFTHVLVIYVPVLQTAFHTVPLTAADWLIATAVAASLLVILEVAKMMLRRRAGEHTLDAAGQEASLA